MPLPWSKFAIRIASDKSLPMSARLVYNAVVWWTTANPGRPVGSPTLAGFAGAALSTTQMALSLLQERGLLKGQKAGNGKATLWELPTTEVQGCPPEFSRTCPNSGRCLPATGQVACRLSSSYLLKAGAGLGVDPKREGDSERDTEGLSPVTLQFGEQIKARTGMRLSEKQLRFLEPAFRSGVPLVFVLAEAESWTHTEGPWGFAGRVQAKWGGIAGLLRQVDGAMKAGERLYLSSGDRAVVSRWGSPEQKAWAGVTPERG